MPVPATPCQPKILAVDDEPSVLAMVVAVLETEGYSVTTSATAEDAANKLRDERFDMVVTDMRMEAAHSGFEVIRAARSLRERPAIIILSAYGIPEEQWRAAGADACLMKPTPMPLLTSTVRQLLAVRKK
jgi:CheY-like chemotaxis protein